MLLLSNEDVAQVLTMEGCVEVLEQAYTDLASHRAINNNRRDTLMPTSDPEGLFRYKSMTGGIPSMGSYAVRVLPDWVPLQLLEDGQRRFMGKTPRPPSGLHLGFILLFDSDEFRLKAIINDGHLNRMRVAGTSGVGAKYLARKNASVVGLIGAGWQAEAQLRALSVVRRLKKVRVYSPTRTRREGFAARMSEALGIDVEAVDEARKVARDADIINTATTSVEPVFSGEWVEPGMYLTSIANCEFDEETFVRSDLIVSSNLDPVEVNAIGGGAGETLWALDHRMDYVPLRRYYGENAEEKPTPFEAVRDRIHVLTDILSGKQEGRTMADQTTLFMKGVGVGIEFAAAGNKAFEEAVRQGVGRELPDDWFTQSVR